MLLLDPVQPSPAEHSPKWKREFTLCIRNALHHAWPLGSPISFPVGSQRPRPQDPTKGSPIDHMIHATLSWFALESQSKVFLAVACFGEALAWATGLSCQAKL